VSKTEDLKNSLRHGWRSSDCSELKHLTEFIIDIIDNVDYDIHTGNYNPDDADTITREQLLGSLDMFAESIEGLRKTVKDRL
jgi:hypothetical protein